MLRTRSIHPFLFAVYPALAFLAHNIEQTSLEAALRPMGFSLAGAIILYLILLALLREKPQAGVLTSILLGLFFSYGHVIDSLEDISIVGVILGRHRWLAPLWLGLAILATWWVMRKAGQLQRLTYPLNVMALMALIIPLLQIGGAQLSTPKVAVQSLAGASDANPALLTAKPDIYYIILDSYSRDDMLKKFYDLDNTPFIQELERLGFVVARCAQSNYGQSELSMASSLNMDYLEALGDQFRPENTRRAGLEELIQHSAVRVTLESLGYSIVALDSGYDATRWSDADLYIAPTNSIEINDFEETFLRTTAFRLVSEGVTLLNLPPDWEKRDEAHRQRILFELEQLTLVPSLPGPKFVFAHIITPHWPYIFGPNGEPIHEHPDSVEGYRNQVLFINQRILPIIENILSSSSIPPIIIVQGDHGAVLDDPQRRMSILNAYFLPGDGAKGVYENISPVNTFRLVFRHYFSLDVPQLEDVSYYSTYEQPYNYEVVPNTRPGCGN